MPGIRPLLLVSASLYWKANFSVSHCLSQRPSSPYNQFRYAVICKNPDCFNIKYGSNSIGDAGFANFLQGTYGVNFVARVISVLTMKAIDLEVSQPCRCQVHNRSGHIYVCGWTDCQLVDTKKNPNYWK